MAGEIISTEGAGNWAQTGERFGEQAEGELGDMSLVASEIRLCEVPAHMHGWRMDKALAALVPEFSRNYLQQLMNEGAVRLGEALASKPSAKARVGERISVQLRPTQQAMAFVPQAMALDVVYEDQDLLVLNKPVGLVVHPAAGNWSGTLLNGLLAHHGAAASLPRAGIVHRLDKDTSGLMLVGKSRRAVDALGQAIALRQVQRQYLALCQGAWSKAAALEVEQPIGRDPQQRLRMAVLRPEQSGAKTARTHVQLLQGNDRASLVTCKLHTGRTHQIRVHMAWLGHPLVGDGLYGGRSQWGLSRQGLHAARLGLNHPVTGQALQFRCEVPADLRQAIEGAGLTYNGVQSG